MAQHTIQATADVREHLASVAHQARRAILQGPMGHRIEGLLAPPDDEGRIAFRGVTEEEGEALAQGTQVHVEYRQAPGSCMWDTRIVSRGVAGNFILALPEVIRVRETRRAERHKLRSTDRVGLTVTHHGRLYPVRVVDVSLTGLSFRYDSARLHLGLGDVVRARVSKGRKSQDIGFEVRHIVPRRSPSGMAQAGARYEKLSLAELDQLLKLVKGV